MLEGTAGRRRNLRHRCVPVTGPLAAASPSPSTGTRQLSARVDVPRHRYRHFECQGRHRRRQRHRGGAGLRAAQCFSSASRLVRAEPGRLVERHQRCGEGVAGRYAPQGRAPWASPGQMHGATLLDAGDKPLRPAILWNDGRSEQQCADAREDRAAFARDHGQHRHAWLHRAQAGVGARERARGVQGNPLRVAAQGLRPSAHDGREGQ